MDDMVSRQAAIDHWRDIIDATDESDKYNMGFVDGLEFCISHLSTMPSAQPERKKGKWTEKEVIHFDDLEAKDIITEWQSAKCDVCGKYHTTPYMYYFSDYEYCPNCGANMRGKQE